MANFTALKTAINNAIKTNGNEEITGAILQAILDAMVETLGDSAITDLENAITTEVTNRENAVGSVAADLAAEALARANKDNQLDNRINAEESNRAIADAALSRTMEQGFQTLGSQMTALNAAISALNAAYQNGYLYGGIATPSSSPSNNKCFYIALQGGTYTNFGGVGVVEGINIIKNDSGWKVEHIYDQTTLLNEFYLLRQQVIQAITSFTPIVIEGDVTNAPDEEDLTSNANHLLQFKNNAYSPLEFSGLGRKYLRKNIAPLSESAPFNGFVEGVTAEETLPGTPTQIFWDRMNTRFVGIKDGIYYAAWTDDDNYVPVSTSLVYMYNGTPYQWTGSDFIVDETEVPNLVNCLTQDMINEANTIYIIRYDYTLKEDITIPANCVLQFDGGSISGQHTITGANTDIQAGLVKILGIDVTLAGTWNVTDAYPEWFGAVGNGSTDDSDAIQLAINTFNKIVFLHNYKVTKGIEVGSNRTLVGIGKPIIYQYTDTAILLNKNRANNMIDKNISICNIVFDSSNVVSTNLNKNRAISFVGVADVYISGCEFLENKSDAIRLGVENNNVYKHNTNVSILDCLFQNYKRQGIAFSDCSNFRIISCNFINANTDAYAIDFEPSAEEGSFATGHGVVKECTIKGFGINIVRSFQKISIQNCIIDTSAVNSFGFAAQSSFDGDIEINNNIFIGNTTYNYVVQSSSTGKTFIERNKISGGKDACINSSGAYSVISKNDIDANKFGINIRNAGTHKVLDNIISAPNNEPIKVFNGASNNTISHNSISGKENIEVLSTGYSVIDSNHITISNTTYSIIVSSATNIIVNNVLNKNINETTQGSVVANNIITS